MTDFKFAKYKDTPLNRDGETLDPDVTLPVLEGDLIGITGDGSGNSILVPADADASVAQPAMGVMMEEARDRSYWTADLHDNGTMSRRLDEEYAKRTQPGDEATYFRYGIYLEDVDGDTTFTPQEPVYLAPGGGVTQTKPTAVGDLVQEVGTAVNETTYYLDVKEAEEITEASGDATFSGDGAATTFDIAHGLSAAPSEYSVTPTSVDAMGDAYVSAGATNLSITFGTAPASGTDNVSFNWSAEE